MAGSVTDRVIVAHAEKLRVASAAMIGKELRPQKIPELTEGTDD